MNASDQIAAINRKAEDEHRAVEQKRERMIQQVRDRCVHEWGKPPEIIPGHTPVGIYCHKCEWWEPFKRCPDGSRRMNNSEKPKC